MNRLATPQQKCAPSTMAVFAIDTATNSLTAVLSDIPCRRSHSVMMVLSTTTMAAPMTSFRGRNVDAGQHRREDANDEGQENNFFDHALIEPTLDFILPEPVRTRLWLVSRIGIQMRVGIECPAPVRVRQFGHGKSAQHVSERDQRGDQANENKEVVRDDRSP